LSLQVTILTFSSLFWKPREKMPIQAGILEEAGILEDGAEV
jgi:hypothetical protein